MGALRMIFAVAAIGLAAMAAAQSPSQRIRGDVVALDGNVLQVKTRAGEALTVKLADNYAVSAIARRNLAAVVPGTFIGTATMPNADGTLRALEVLVFPESARGSGEGHYPWDLEPGSMMTNATVSDVVAVDAARRMTLKYKDGQQVVARASGCAHRDVRARRSRDARPGRARHVRRHPPARRNADRDAHQRRQGRAGSADVGLRFVAGRPREEPTLRRRITSRES